MRFIVNESLELIKFLTQNKTGANTATERQKHKMKKKTLNKMSSQVDLNMDWKSVKKKSYAKTQRATLRVH